MTALRVTEREYRFFRLIWKGQVFRLFGAPSLFLVALGVGVGGMIDEPGGLDGLDYLAFIAPGLLVGAPFQIAAGSGLWPVMAGHRWVGFHRAMVSTPIGPSAIVGGYLVWLLVRASAEATVVLVVASLLGGIDGFTAILAVPIAAATAVSFAAPLTAYTATCDSDRVFDPLMRVVVTPLFLFSGVFFPTDALPQVVEWLVRLFPLWHGVELARAITAGADTELPPAVSIAVIGVWLIGGWLAARVTFARRLTP